MKGEHFHLSLVLTHACNLACHYCYTGKKFARAMPSTIAERALEYAVARGRVVALTFFGGEPLLAYDRLVEVVGLAARMAERGGVTFRTQVTTNGTLLDRARADELARLGVRTTLSLDGVREAHEATRPAHGGGSSWEAAVHAAHHIRAAGAPLEIIAVTDPSNVRLLAASVRFLAELGAESIGLNPCYEAAWSDDDLAVWGEQLTQVASFYAERMRAGRPVSIRPFDRKLARALAGPTTEARSCGLGRENVAVAPSGNLYPCERLVGEDRDGRFVIGTLADGADPARVERVRRGPADPSCGGCAERWRCSSSCACANLAETGETDLPGGTQCWFEQTIASLSDELGRSLIEEGCETFVALAYGKALDGARLRPAPPRRLPLLPEVP